MHRNRGETFDDLARDPNLDALVVGAGINGISTFRELALQGLRVLLVDRGDYCGACSSAPSRMIHGGLRYLENGEFGLVRESLEERNALLRNAPHMVFPLPTTVPIRAMFSGLMNGALSFAGLRQRPSERGALAVKAGLWLYDAYTRKGREMPPHQFRGKAETFAKWPALRPDLFCSATYHDAWISHPERLGIELIRDGLDANGAALALNHVEVARDAGFALTDRAGTRRVTVDPKVVVNATGAWVDETNASLARTDPPPARFVGGTKGSHLILDHPELLKSLAGHMIYFENTDGRVCILFPYLDRVLLGSTDIRVDAPGNVRCEDEEVDYILASLAHVFPGIAVAPEQIVYRYAGVRPLPLSDASFTGRISRDHSVREIAGDPPVVCMVGGKWTTFRAFGEQSADAVLRLLGRTRRVDTEALAIGGGRDFPREEAGIDRLVRDLSEEFGVTLSRSAHAVSHYGTGARDILELSRAAQHDPPLAAGTEYTRAEIRHLIQTEQVETLDDLLLRRTSLAITGILSMEMIDGATAILADELGWSDRTTQGAREAFLYRLDREHGVSAAVLETRNQRGI